MKSTSKKSSKKSATTSQQPEVTAQDQTSTESVDLKNSATLEEKQDLPQENTVSAAEETKPDQAKTSAPQEKKINDTEDAKAKASSKPATVPSAANPASPASPSAYAGKLVAVLALLLAGGAVTFSAIMWQQVTQLEQKLNASMNEGSNNTPNISTENLTLLAADAAKQQTQALTGKVDNLQRTIEGVKNELEAINQGDKQVDLITDIYNSPKTDMLPLSIRSLLTSAQLHVTLSNSVQPMLATLTSIDNHLKANGMEDNNMLRQALQADIETIRNYPTTDPIKAAREINALVDLISQDNAVLSVRTLTPPTVPPVDLSVNVDLSDAPTGNQPTADSSTWGTIKNTLSWTADKASEVGSATWDQLSTLVQVTPLNNDARQVILSNNEGAMLRENIKLRLIGARITILQGQYEQAGKELLDIKKVITTYFDNGKVGTILQRLESLSAELKNTSFPQPVKTIAALDTLQSNQ